MSDFKCDPTTRAELDASPSKLADVAVIQAALGNTRRIRLKRDSNANAADPWATGVEFRNVGSTGTLKSTAGKITSLGRIKGSTIKLPADVTTGSSVMRIEGNGRWIQVSLGGPGSGKDVISGNFTATNGLSIKPDFAISGKRLKPSGTGPFAPALTAESPATLEFWNWQNPAAPVLIDTLPLDNRVADMVMTDAEMAAEMGDIRVTQSTKTVVYGDFEFGAIYLSAHSGLNGDAVKPLDQVMIGCKPYGRWNTYPFHDTYDAATDGTHPKAFKVIMKTANGSILHIFQMRDGKAINDPSLRQERNDVPVGQMFDPIRPFFNCRMILPWQNGIPKLSAKKNKFFPGLDHRSWRESQFKAAFITNAPYPLYSQRYQSMGAGGWHRASKWAMANYNEYTEPPGWNDPSNADPESWNTDPYLHGNQNSYERTWRWHGWGYEPGCPGTHDWMTGPGGVRIDRAAIPVPLALYADQPTGNRLKGMIPYKELANEFGLNYFNHSGYMFTDLKSFSMIPDAPVVNGQKALGGTYYAPNMNYAPGGLGNNIQTHAIQNGSEWPARDKDGLHHFSGWGPDFLHNYQNGGWMTLLNNSPMHVLAAKMSYHITSMVQAGDIAPESGATPGLYLIRQWAWRMNQQVIMWKLASSDNPLSMERELIERRIQTEFEAVYDRIVAPYNAGSTDPLITGYVELGIGTRPWSNEVLHGGSPCHDSKIYYNAIVFMLMKQTGLWAALKKRSQRCSDMMDFSLQCLDKNCIDYLYHTHGWSEATGNEGWSNPSLQVAIPVAHNQTPYYPKSWQEWAQLNPRPGSASMIHNQDGSLRADGYGTLIPVGEPATALLRWQYVMMRRDYFPEVPHPLLNATATLVQGWIDETASYVLAAPTPQGQQGRDFGPQLASHCVLKVPSEVGPA